MVDYLHYYLNLLDLGGIKVKYLSVIEPTDEQLKLISNPPQGVEVIRGAAGSGKTTTALHRLKTAVGRFANRNRRQGITSPVEVLVLTFNRTLKGYVSEIVEDQTKRIQTLGTANVNITVNTFSHWAKELIEARHGVQNIFDDDNRRARIEELGASLGYSSSFLKDEVEYLLGRFLPEQFEDYIEIRRDGRGASPRVDKTDRRKILDNVIYPYTKLKKEKKVVDWNDMAILLAKENFHQYDIVIVDETQDFSANQLRAIANHLAEQHSLTFIVDTAQRIYARGFTWLEAGYTVRPQDTNVLSQNYRNTKEIAGLARGVLEGLQPDQDTALPLVENCRESGIIPRVLVGFYNDQVSYALDFIKRNVDLSEETVAFLHPVGWFKYLEGELNKARLPYVRMTRRPAWPTGSENIALSTLASAKGLEFDYVFIIGLAQENFEHGDEHDDDLLVKFRKLLAMGIGRARKDVILGYKESDRPALIDFLDDTLYEEVKF